ncbi:putative mediator of RNA polymerase II transcription subunit 12 [Galendromus occidentalis]|uniref:Mediator of RNA polymerase II transcription subunit 12 n=1 Tax=Galendromus occidentalis TaxID=34638 RepID=A0AAJ7SF06_9ACAR|nr:putative mediator of RNA polymerase II transcription subunit 12 [Galendromus occidentalis]
MRSFCASALLVALFAPKLAMSEIRQGGTQGWELRSVSLSELSKLGLATGPSDRRPIFQSIHGGPPRGGPNFQQVQILGYVSGAGPGQRGPRSFHGANIPLENLFARAQVHRGPPGLPIEAPISRGPQILGAPGLSNLRLPPGWQAIQIDANQFKSIASGKPIDIPGLGNGPVHISSQFAQNIASPSGHAPGPQDAAVSELPNNKLEIPQHAQTFQHGPFRFAHVSEEVQLIGQNGQKTIEVPVGTGHDQIKQVVQQQSEPQSSSVPAAEGGINIPGGLPAAIQQFLKDNTPQFQLQDDEEQKQAEQQVQSVPQHQHQSHQHQSHQHQQEAQQHVQGPPQHLQQAQHVQQEQHHPQERVHFPQQQIHSQHVQQQAPQPVVRVQPAESPISNIPPGWKVIRVTAEQLAAYQRGGPAPWLQHQQQQQPNRHRHIPQQVQHQEQNRPHFHQSHPDGPRGFPGQAESYQGPPAQAPPVRLPPRANVKVVYLPFNSVKTAQHQQPLYREERQEARRQQAWQPPSMEHGQWKAITPSFIQASNGPWKQQPESSNGGPAYATSERYHHRGNHIEEHRHEHPPNGQHHQQHHHQHENQRVQGVVTRENAGKWY